MRALFFIIGFISLVTGVVGAFLPLLPTTPFVILAAYCFAQSSPRFHVWLINHRFFGPMIENWNNNRAIPLKAKYLAVSMMALSCGILWYRLWSTSWLFLALLSSILCVFTVIWIWRLPSS